MPFYYFDSFFFIIFFGWLFKFGLSLEHHWTLDRLVFHIWQVGYLFLFFLIFFILRFRWYCFVSLAMSTNIWLTGTLIYALIFWLLQGMFVCLLGDLWYAAIYVGGQHQWAVGGWLHSDSFVLRPPRSSLVSSFVVVGFFCCCCLRGSGVLVSCLWTLSRERTCTNLWVIVLAYTV